MVLDEALLDEISRRLTDAVPESSQVMLFGSRATGRNGVHSDVDLLVIEPAVEDWMAESVRLRRTLNGLGVPIDLVVMARREAVARGAVKGTLVERALREGRILVDR